MDQWIVLFYVLQFIKLIRFPSGKPIVEVITRRYGRDAWIQIRRWENALRKFQKAKLDVVFLEKCLLYGLIPKFLNFKLFRRRLHREQFYREWQTSLLERELKAKELKAKRRRQDLQYKHLLECHDKVKDRLCFVDYNHILYFIHNNVDKYKDNVTFYTCKEAIFSWWLL